MLVMINRSVWDLNVKNWWWKLFSVHLNISNDKLLKVCQWKVSAITGKLYNLFLRTYVL